MNLCYLLKLHIYLQNYRKDQTEKNCDVQFTQSYIIDEKNNYTMGKKYENILFSAKSVPLKSRYIPVIKHKDITGSYGSLCFDEYFDVFDLEKNEFKNINYRFPLEVVDLLHFVSTGKKFVLVSINEVDYGIDFTQDSPSFSYDKNWNFSYDGAKYSLHHNNIIIFDDNFKIINNVTLSSRSYTGIESVVSTNNESVYFFGAKDNMMSIDKLTGF